MLILPLAVTLFFLCCVFIFCAALWQGFRLRPASQKTTIPGSCPVGYCATSLQSGGKRCPEAGESLAYVAEEEVCNEKYSCSNPLTPYAVNADGSSNISGVCPPGVACPCRGYLQCPAYITSAFTVSSGSPFGTLDVLEDEQAAFTQITKPARAPITFTDPSRTFCSAPGYWLPRTTPGCTEWDDTPYGLSKCQSVPGVCKEGIPALLAEDVEAVNSENFLRYPLACVAGSSCPLGLTALHDTTRGTVVCRYLRTP